ncbi:MAG: NfeD family protein [Parvibaculum sp.]
MEGFFENWGEWTWWIIALGLAALELVLPGVFLIWLAGAALVVGVLGIVLDMSWQWEIALFAVLSVVSAYTGYRVTNKDGDHSDHPSLNKRSQSYVGQRFVVVEPIRNGRGKVKVGDTLWQATGPDIEAGADVLVTSVDGTLLKVEPV